MKHEHIRIDTRSPAPMPPHLWFDDASARLREPGFLWCIHCERAYQHGDPREGEALPACPYQGCEGSLAEPWAWAKVRRLNPAYPPQPTHGIVYPLFGRGRYSRR
jgi:hypothetical protein